MKYNYKIFFDSGATDNITGCTERIDLPKLLEDKWGILGFNNMKKQVYLNTEHIILIEETCVEE